VVLKGSPVALSDTDRLLLKRCLANEPDSWKDFADRFLGLFVHVVNHTAHARSVRLAAADVDDLCGEAFLQILANDAAVLRRFRGRSSLSTYLTVVVRRIVVREIARRRSDMSQEVSASTPEPEAPEQEQQRIDDRDEVHRMLLGLPDLDAEVVRRFHLIGQSYREISEQLHIPENTIGPMLARARERLRRQHGDREAGS
jgi:RNA polymerase sigma-70 factor (ECF subfamily)